ncbi:hypothetical protein M8J76_010324 [Diaphorina citri]|nr:hypothetical protein M8J76_010324 [Diaphorina citri]
MADDPPDKNKMADNPPDKNKMAENPSADESSCSSSVIRHPEGCTSQGKPSVEPAPEFRPPLAFMETVTHDITYGQDGTAG